MADNLGFNRYVRIDVGNSCGCGTGGGTGDASAAASRANVSAGQAAASATEAQGAATVALQARDEAIAAAGTALQPGDVGTAAYANTDAFATAAQGALADTALQSADLGTAAFQPATAFATSGQGALADTALQPGVVGSAAFQPTSAFASAAQGGLATSALQPGASATQVQFAQVGVGATPRQVQQKLRDFPLSIRDFGGVLNGTADDTAAFVATVAEAAAQNRDVLLPSGVTRLTATVFVPSGVNIQGEGCQPYTEPNAAAAEPGNGSWLHFDHPGVGIHFAGVNAASASASLSAVGTMRTHAAPGPGWTPTVYDYDIVVQGVETFLDDVVLLNAYKGVWVTLSGYGRLWTHRLRGQVFAEGFNLEQSYDTCRLRDTHFWPYWSQQADVIAWQQANTKVLRIARCDNTMISGLFSIYSQVGLEVYGTAEGTAYRLRLSDIDFDSTAYGIHVLDTSDDASLFMSNVGVFGAESAANGRGLWVEGTGGRYQLSNTDLSLIAQDGIRVDGTDNVIDSVNTKVRSWNQNGAGASAYEVAAGNLLRFAGAPVATDGGAAPVFGATAGVYRADLGSGLASGVTDGSGDYTVTHGLPAQPSAVFLSGIGTGSLQYVVASIAGTTFTLRVMDAEGNPAASQPFNIAWRGEKF